jgi:hypothetical protein
MANYVYVENNVIKEYYDFLPQNWKNVSGLNLIKDENYLKSIGWYKVIKNTINYDPNCQVITNYEYYFDNNNVYQNPIIESFTPISQQAYVPNQITATQIRLWLVRNNIPLSSIEDIIKGVENDLTRNELLVQWEYAPYVERNNPFINSLGALLGFSPDQIDQAFIEAEKY